MGTYFVTAIDTDAGKTYATGVMASVLANRGEKVMTMKIAQTGCKLYSEDIEKHRFLMNKELMAEDLNGDSCPYIFGFPASPHLSAKLEGKVIDPNVICQKVNEMEKRYEQLLVEGVGGLMVPLTKDLLVVDLLEKMKMPVILVTSGKLGSINHTLLTLEVMRQRGIQLYGLLYNHYPIGNLTIAEETIFFLKETIQRYYPDALWGELPLIEEKETKKKRNFLKGWF